MQRKEKAERPRQKGNSEDTNQPASVVDSIHDDDSSCNEAIPAFEGFEPANTTPVPDILFDQIMSKLNGAELKALLYIIRRTWGFKKTEDTISLSQFQHGITTRDGRVLDQGCGVKDRTTLVRALASLMKRGFIKCVKSYNEETKEHEATHYSIRFKSDNQGSGQNIPGVVGKPDQGSGQNQTTPSPILPTRGSGQTRRTRNSNTTNSIQVSLSSSANASSDAGTPDENQPEPPKDELTPEQKTRAYTLKAKIDDRCGKLATKGPTIAENIAIKTLVRTYGDADIDDVEHYLQHCHFKWSKPDFKFKIRGNILLDEMEPTLKLFAENPKLRDATSAPTANSRPAQQEGIKYKKLPPIPAMPARQVAGVR